MHDAEITHEQTGYGNGGVHRGYEVDEALLPVIQGFEGPGIPDQDPVVYRDMEMVFGAVGVGNPVFHGTVCLAETGVVQSKARSRVLPELGRGHLPVRESLPSTAHAHERLGMELKRRYAHCLHPFQCEEEESGETEDVDGESLFLEPLQCVYASQQVELVSFPSVPQGIDQFVLLAVAAHHLSRSEGAHVHALGRFVGVHQEVHGTVGDVTVVVHLYVCGFVGGEETPFIEVHLALLTRCSRGCQRQHYVLIIGGLDRVGLVEVGMDGRDACDIIHRPDVFGRNPVPMEPVGIEGA